MEAALERWRAGDGGALECLLPLIYADLRRIARSVMQATPGHFTLQPTALVHEVILRLMGRDSRAFTDTEHLINTSARMMRQVLVDRARAAATNKRGGTWRRDEFSESLQLPIPDGVDVIELDAAIALLEQHDLRMANAVQFHYFVGLTLDEIAGILGVAKKTVQRDVAAARVWLRARLED